MNAHCEVLLSTPPAPNTSELKNPQRVSAVVMGTASKTSPKRSTGLTLPPVIGLETAGSWVLLRLPGALSPLADGLVDVTSCAHCTGVAPPHGAWPPAPSMSKAFQLVPAPRSVSHSMSSVVSRRRRMFNVPVNRLPVCAPSGLNAVPAFATRTSSSHTSAFGKSAAGGASDVVTNENGENVPETEKLPEPSIVPLNSIGSGAWKPAWVSLLS